MCALSPETGTDAPLPEDWPRNYFNYFTEIEEHFQRCRGTGLFLLSPLDWALIETWRLAGIPLEAVLKGISEAFDKWHSRKQKRRLVNSIAYCTQAVMEQAGRTPAARQPASAVAEDLFETEQIAAHLRRASTGLRVLPHTPLHEIAETLDSLAAEAAIHVKNLEALEQRLTVLEEKIVAQLRVQESDESLLQVRQSLDSELRPYRGKMTADQIALLERRYLDSALLEKNDVPRLSLFYLH